MSPYVVALFLHVSGAIGIWITLGIWLFGLAALRRARQVEQVRALAWLIVVTTPLMLLSLLILGAAGFYMALTVWGLQTGWIDVSLVSMLLIGPIGAFVLDPRMHVILDLTREGADGPLSQEMVARTHDPVLVMSARVFACVLLGVVFLMTTKPSVDLAIPVMAGALALGLVSGLPAFWIGRRVSTLSARQAVDPFARKTIWTRRY